MAIELQSDEARQDLVKAEQAITATIRQEAERLFADSTAGRLSKAHPGEDMPEDPTETPPDAGPEDEGAPPEEMGSPSSETPLPEEENAPMSHEELVQAFQNMDPAMLDAYKAAIAEVEGGGGDQPDAPPADAPPSDESFGKSETFRNLKAEVRQLRGVVAQLTKSAPRPQPPAQRINQRAATGPSRPAAQPAPVRLSKAETMKQLMVAVKNPSLSKADRALVYSFCDGQRVDVSHLLPKGK